MTYAERNTCINADIKVIIHALCGSLRDYALRADTIIGALKNLFI